MALAAIAVVGAACSDSTTSSPATGGTTSSGAGHVATVDAAAGDLLAQVCEEGVIRVSTDPAYPPQSSLNEQTGEYEGFDIDVATEVATRLGVDIEWETPSWDVLTAGNWNDRWEMSVGSMTPTNDRQAVLRFTEPYYYTPAVVVLPSDSTVSDVTTDLDGTTIGVCSACTYEQYLDKTLAIDGFTFDFMIDDAKIQGYDTDTTALADLATGRLDAVDHVGDDRAGLGRRRQRGHDPRLAGLLRAAQRGVRHGVVARQHDARRGRGRDRGRCTRTDAHDHVAGVVRRSRPDRADLIREPRRGRREWSKGSQGWSERSDHPRLPPNGGAGAVGWIGSRWPRRASPSS